MGCHGSQQMTGPACDTCVPLCWYDFFLPVPMSVSHGADILQAYADGADFFYMVNDDLLLLTHGWADRFVQGDVTKSRNALRAHVQCVGSSWSVYTRCRRCLAKKRRPSSNAHGASSIASVSVASKGGFSLHARSTCLRQLLIKLLRTLCP